MKKFKVTIISTSIVIFLLVVFILIQRFSYSNNSQDSKLKGKKILFLGDSLTAIQDVDYKEAIRNPQTANKKEYYKYVDWIRELTGAECYNYGYSGSSIARITMPDAPDNSSFLSRYEEIIKAYPNSRSFDLIVIFGGVNDYMQSVPVSFFENGDPYSFYGALKKIVTGFQSVYPHAKIVLMNPLISNGEGGKFDFVKNKTNYVLEDYRKAIGDVARTHGAVQFKTEEFSGLNPNNPEMAKNFYIYVGDGVHPNPEGHKRIAIPLINLLEGLVD